MSCETCKDINSKLSLHGNQGAEIYPAFELSTDSSTMTAKQPDNHRKSSGASSVGKDDEKLSPTDIPASARRSSDVGREPSGDAAINWDASTANVLQTSEQRGRHGSNAYDMHRVSTQERSISHGDKEKRHSGIIKKLMSHKLSPDFLK